MDKPYLSIVIPVYNEEEVLPELIERLGKVVASINKRYEIIFVNDGSSDKTIDILKESHYYDANIKVLNFSRNFGHQAALTAGIDFSTGDNVVSIDADLQDPPELIPAMLEKREKGADVVFAMRKNRTGESPFRLAAIKLYYSLMKKVSGIEIPKQAGDFRLMSRRAVNSLKTLKEQNRYLRGLSCWIGFPQDFVYYNRPPRHSGTTKYPFTKLLKLALDGITNFSYLPLRMATYFGVLISSVCFIYILYILYLKLTGSPIEPKGWASTMVAVLFIGSIQLICLGIIGEYIGRICDEGKNRPVYIVMETLGFEKDKSENTKS